MDMQEFRREIPVRYEVDVFVAGGGSAGITAAVAAARNGSSVYLAEATGCLGGQGTSGGVPAFMRFTDGINFLADGLGREVLHRVTDAGGIGLELDNAADINPDDGLSLRAEVVKRVYDDLLLEAGVRFTFNTHLIAVETDEGRVTSAILSAKSGLFAVKAKVYIDCTGDGDLAAWAGAPFEKGDAEGNMQAGTLCSLWADIDWKNAEKKANAAPKVPQAYRDGVLSIEDRHLPGIHRVGKHTGSGNIGHAFGVDNTDEVSVTKAYVESRRRLAEYETFYRRYMKGYDQIELVATAAMMGIRETRRIMGDYVLNIEDFKTQAVFEDEIGRYCFPVEVHASNPGRQAYQAFITAYKTTYRYKEGESYGIPYRALIPRSLKNVLVAGRCISCDRHMHGSLRVMPGCFITGQAAGAAASLAAKGNSETRSVSVKELHRLLKDMGMYLPNAP